MKQTLWDTKNPRNAPEPTSSPADAEPKEEEKVYQRRRKQRERLDSAGVGASWIQVELPENGYSRIVREAEERPQAREQRRATKLRLFPAVRSGGNHRAQPRAPWPTARCRRLNL